MNVSWPQIYMLYILASTQGEAAGHHWVWWMIKAPVAELFELSSGQGLAKGKVQGSLMELL